MPSGARRAIAPVLLVEDDDDTRAALVELLESEGFAVRAVADGTSALAALRVERFLIILLDLKLPDMPGSEVRRRQLEEPSLASVPVVVLTADPTARIEGVAVVRKPFDIDDLLAVIRAEIDAADRARSRDLLAAMSDVRKKLEKTMSDLDAIRRGRSDEDDEAPPSTRRGSR